MPDRRLSAREREEVSAVSMIAADSLKVDERRWTPAHAAVLRRAAGYREVERYNDNPYAQAFFRKQLGWYRRDPRITWLDAAAPDNAARVLAGIDSGQAKEADDA